MQQRIKGLTKNALIMPIDPVDTELSEEAIAALQLISSSEATDRQRVSEFIGNHFESIINSFLESVDTDKN